MSLPRVFGVVVGEPSGDALGASLILALRQHYPDARFIGIAGPQMLAMGAETLAPMERLSVMGLVEVLGRLRELFKLRAALFSWLAAEKLDAFIGIDAPDFNLGLEQRFKSLGIPTIHYVSPSVWAWRQGRVKTLAKSVDLVLCLLPFEKSFYDEHHVRAEFVGHPLADNLPLVNDTRAARAELGLPMEGHVLAVLPGSRRGEVAQLGPVLEKTMSLFLQQHPTWTIAIPAVNALRRAQIVHLFAGLGDRIHIFDEHWGAGVGRKVMAAADQVWLASGTATLEAMLLKKPMLVMYRFHWLTYWIARWLVRIKLFSLPNLLFGRPVVPELIQGDVQEERILYESARLETEAGALTQLFTEQHQKIRCHASERAAAAIAGLIDDKS
ncbi:MAG: lipid-A-disaccharide synthase [Pseudomonadales bacterium]|nr:lipid-A-disaccharide synthase [Pseudomonadales bacterium]